MYLKKLSMNCRDGHVTVVNFEHFLTDGFVHCFIMCNIYFMLTLMPMLMMPKLYKDVLWILDYAHAYGHLMMIMSMVP